MSLLVSNLVPADAPLADFTWARLGSEGVVRTLEQASADRWFAVDVLVVPATRPVNSTERAIVALSRAAGPVALAVAFMVPVVVLWR